MTVRQHARSSVAVVVDAAQKLAVELRRKLAILADAAKYDASCASSGSRRKTPAGGLGNAEGMGICHSYTPDGRCVSLLKILLTNECIYDCQYCINRSTSSAPRARFSPAEVVRLTLEFYRRNYIEGLFLSSGVLRSPDATMEQLIAVARSLREEHRFGGYIHLKATPGVSAGLLAIAGRHADRLSVNVELPTEADLRRLAPEKNHADVDAAMGAIRSEREAAVDTAARFAPPAFAPAGQSTQMIVGATPTSDRTILDTATRLYRAFDLRRVYYSAYSPIDHADGRLPAERPPLIREHRLYEADWLVRFYGFEPRELTTDDTPDLSLTVDPKLAWALRNRHRFPVDVHRAPRELLLRVPGLGVRNVDRILQARRHGKITLADLARLRVPVRRCAPFLLTADNFHRPAQELDRLALIERVRPARQLTLFEAGRAAATGQL